MSRLWKEQLTELDTAVLEKTLQLGLKIYVLVVHIHKQPIVFLNVLVRIKSLCFRIWK